MDEPAALELGQGEMSRVRLGVGEHREPRRVEAPDLLGIGPEGRDRAILERVEGRPDAGRRAKVRDARLGRDTGAGEDDARLRATDQFSEACRIHGRDRRVLRVDGFNFSTEIRVRFAETDAQGVAHNAEYLVWYEVARIAYLDRFR